MTRTTRTTGLMAQYDRPMAILAAAWFSLPIVATCGCAEWTALWAPKQTASAEPGSELDFALAAPPESSRSPRDPIQVHMQFDVVRVEMPIDSVHHSAKVWNHVDEMRVDADLMALLVRNGIRAGVAADSSWPAINALLEAEGAEAHRGQKVVQTGMPLWVALEGIAESESIFVYQADGRMVGETFSSGVKCLRVDYEMLAGEESAVVVKVTPEIHRENEAPRWTLVEQDYQLSRATDRRIYVGLSAEWTLNPGDFLVLGPSQSDRVGQRLGDRFLTRMPGADHVDMLLFITPRPFRVGPTAK